MGADIFYGEGEISRVHARAKATRLKWKLAIPYAAINEISNPYSRINQHFSASFPSHNISPEAALSITVHIDGFTAPEATTVSCHHAPAGNIIFDWSYTTDMEEKPCCFIRQYYTHK